jgi:hypothetical protein
MSAPTITLEILDAEGCGVQHELPARFEVCGRCEGHGTHTNPAIDGNGLTAEDFDQAGPEFLEDYLGGVYDVPCHECHGARVVTVLDRARCPRELLKAYDKKQRDDADYYAMCAAERRAGA